MRNTSNLLGSQSKHISILGRLIESQSQLGALYNLKFGVFLRLNLNCAPVNKGSHMINIQQKLYISQDKSALLVNISVNLVRNLVTFLGVVIVLAASLSR